MTTIQLEQSKYLQNLIAAREKQLKYLKGDCTQCATTLTQHTFTQHNSTISRGMVTTYESKAYRGYEADIQAVLLATKQTIIHIYEREISRLKEELYKI